MGALCAKCRGDGLYNDYDSEVEEEELRRMDEECNTCIKRDYEVKRRREEVRNLFGMDFVDNNKRAEERKEESEKE